MAFYVVRGRTVSAFERRPATLSDEEILITSLQELEATRLSQADLVAIWNALPGAAAVSRFKDRKSAVKRIWVAFQELPLSNPAGAGSAAGPRPGSKQAAGHSNAATSRRGNGPGDHERDRVAGPYRTRAVCWSLAK